MDNIEQYVKNNLKQDAVLIAIITESPQLFDSEQAKRNYSRYQLEILNCKHPTMCRDTSGRYAKVFIYGVTHYMKEDNEYLQSFLNACEGENVTEIISIKV